jgi:orotidine-5'-phosphate decarboxylase
MFQFVDNSHWLTPGEQEEAIEAMLRYGILKTSNARDLPLKMGGDTDIYVNLRQARNHPEAIRFFSEMFANPIRRLRADRIAEIPQAVTCFAGPLATSLNLPLCTIRETVKGGRVSDANLIGEINYGERIALFDDVITDGASKLDGYRLITGRGAKPTLVVAVDRQQGWQAKFSELDIAMPVWSGMTLHDIRSYLINKKLMERCSKSAEDKNPLILALDGKSWNEILPVIDRLRPTGTILKVNDLAVGMGIDVLVPALQTYGRVMVDLKHYDIPPTVANSCRRIAPHNPWAVTIHASGGKEMAEAAVKSFVGTDTMVLAVTVLTSFDEKTCKEVYHRLPLAQVKHLARLMWEAGVRGFVCSPEEVAELRALFPEATFVTPGVRSPGADTGAQKRVSTIREALDRGANHAVVGSQVFGATDPVAEVQRIMTEELHIP